MDVSFPLLVAGLGILTLGLIALAVLMTRTSAPVHQESLLAPVLAADALDDDLRVLYARSLVLDAMWASTSFATNTRSPLGRELRSYLIEAQAGRCELGRRLDDVIGITTEIGRLSANSDESSWAAVQHQLFQRRAELRDSVRNSQPVDTPFEPASDVLTRL